MSAVRLLGVDPGFASVGFCMIEIGDNDAITIEHFDLIETEKSTKKQNVFASEDNLRRTVEIYRALNAITGDAVAICAEAMSFPPNASIAAKMAMCWGALAALSHVHRIPILQASPQAIKIATAGRKDASKDDMSIAVSKRFPRLVEKIVAMPKGDREHPVDALGAALTCIDSDIVKMWRRTR